MQEGHGSGNQSPGASGGWSPLPSGDAGPEDDDTSPGGSWAPAPGTTQAPSGQPGYTQPGYTQPGDDQPGHSRPAEPGYGQPGYSRPAEPGYGQPSTPTTELGTWTMSAGGHGTWEPPPGGGGGGWGPPPGGGYGQPGGGYGQPPGSYGEPGGPQPPRRNRPLIYVLVAVLAAALGAGAVFALQTKSQPSSSLSPQDIPTPAGSQGNDNTNTSGIDAQAVAAKVEPGVVDITSRLRYTGQVFEGTGMVLTSSGLVLTNNHVVDGSTGLTATIVTSGRRYAAQVVGTDATEDVALLKLIGVSGLRTVKVGNSAKLSLGTPVVALGNAGGEGGAPAVTSGAISALRRTITASDSGSGTSETLHNMLQTSAPIAEGDSGGPLSNAAGEVIGMDTAANTRTLGGPGTSQGFAIPINRALAIARQMAAGHGSATIHLGQPAFIGIAVAGASPNAASSADTPQQQLQQLQQTAEGQGGGVNSSGGCLANGAGNPVPSRIAPASTGTLIAGVFCDAPAHTAGLTGGDVILAVNGQTVGAPTSLTDLLAKYHPGDRISVTWMDTGGQRHRTSLTLAAGPAK